MSSSVNDYETIRTELQTLIARHRRTRAWFWRTGISSMAAAGLWLFMYNYSQETASIREQFAIIVGAALMWILFTWAFFLLRKLNRLTAKIKNLEKKIAVILNVSAGAED